MGAHCSRSIDDHCCSGVQRWFRSRDSSGDFEQSEKCSDGKTNPVCSDSGRTIHDLACLRASAEARLEPLTQAERHALDLLAGVLDVPVPVWKPGEQPAALLDWLFLGDIGEAMDLDLLDKHGINSILNLMSWWELKGKGFTRQASGEHYMFYTGLDFAYEEVDSEDTLNFDMVGKSWPIAQAFIKKCREEGRRVLVHCRAGHNRSACICVCWLLACEGMNLLSAVQHVQQRRGSILSNHAFRLQLVRLALELDRLGTDNASSLTPRPQQRYDAIPIVAA